MLSLRIIFIPLVGSQLSVAVVKPLIKALVSAAQLIVTLAGQEIIGA
jgi:hypothetical protein